MGFSKETVNAFLDAVSEWPIQSVEYTFFLRFRVAEILDDWCQNTLQPLLIDTMVYRDAGPSLATPEGLEQVE